MQEGWLYPPLLCFGLEDLFEKSFAVLSVLFGEIKKGEKQFKKRDLALPKHSKVLGQNRFGPDDLAKWQKAHPYAPSGKPSASHK